MKANARLGRMSEKNCGQLSAAAASGALPDNAAAKRIVRIVGPRRATRYQPTPTRHLPLR